jgi:hypothetical protein
MKTTIEKKYDTTLEMLSKLERIMLLQEWNTLPPIDEAEKPAYYEAIEVRKSIGRVLKYLNENR